MKKIHILSFNNFSNPLLENVQSAKDFLFRIAKYNKANPKKELKSLEKLKEVDLRGIDLDDKEKMRALEEPRFKEGALRGKPIFATVKDFLEKKNNLSYTYPFVYFALEMPSLEIGLNDKELAEKIKKIEDSNKNEEDKLMEVENLTNDLNFSNLLRKLEKCKQISDRSPLKYGSPEGYVKAKESGNIPDMPAIEKLNDDLDQKLRELKIYQFFSNHESIIKDYFRKEVLGKKDSSPEMQELFKETFDTLYPILTLPGKEGTIKVYKRDKHGNRTEEVLMEYPNKAENVLLSQSGIYKDTKNHPEISNKNKPEAAFRYFLDSAKGVESGWRKNVLETIENIENQAPAVRILNIFTSDNVMLTSSRTWFGISKICKITGSSFCIESQSTWNSTLRGCLQISINQLELGNTNSNSLLSYTINPDLIVRDYANKQNMRPLGSGKHFSYYLEKDNVPHSEEILNIVKQKYKAETAIKNLLDKIYKEMGGSKSSYTPFLSYLGAQWIQAQIQMNEISQEDWDELFLEVSGAIKKEFKLTEKQVIDYFEERGFSTVQDFLIFKDFMGNDFNWDLADKIFQISSDNMEVLRAVEGFGSDVEGTFSALINSFHEVEKIFKTRNIPEMGKSKEQ